MVLKNKTSGMATTCYEYLKNYKKNNPILISSCDYAVVFDEDKLKKITLEYSQLKMKIGKK